MTAAKPAPCPGCAAVWTTQPRDPLHPRRSIHTRIHAAGCPAAADFVEPEKPI